ncbi:PadR family transcriptional regulator [Salipaludibacillus daqingensis]|uniref:PadR family transcriptional regulator n=1 Tax=Salipaludibacillus daqingensis TaxID=3041001 RepID=UPI0024737C42|nr:PadR family transcriptional regulator [Salipaludibacillus daqingensis]
MKDPFHNLKSSMKKTVFKNLLFSDERKNAVKEAIRERQSKQQLHSWKEETLVAVLESLQHEAKHGYDLSILLIQKNELSFQNKEGLLYTLLHSMEMKGIVTSTWIYEKKYYSLAAKGKKYLTASKEVSSKQRFSLKHLLEEAST